MVATCPTGRKSWDTMFKIRSLRPILAAVSILLCAATLPVNGGLPKRHPAIAGYFLFQQDIPAKTVVLKGQGSTPANPSAGWYKLFVDNTGALKLLDSAGSVTTFGAGGGGFELQTQTSFTNNSTPAIYLKAPGPSTTPFLQFLDNSDASMLKIYYDGGIESAADFYSGTGVFATTQTAVKLRTAGNYDVGVFREYGSLSFEAANPSTSGVPKAWLDFTGTQNNTGITASTEYNAFWYNPPRTYTWATGAISNQRFFYLRAPTLAFGGASTVTNAATVAISGAPIAGTNATISNAYALWVASGLSQFDGRINAVNSDASNPSVQAQNDTGTALRGISLSGYGAYLTSRSSIGANIAQTGTLSGNTTAATALIKREHVLSGFTSTGPVLQVEQATGTGNLLSLVNSGGTQAAFDQNGVLLIGGASSPGTATKLQLGTPSTANNNVNLYLEPTATTITPLAIQGNSSQTADLFQVFKSDGTKIFSIDTNGTPASSRTGVGSNTVFGTAAGNVLTGGQTNNTILGSYSATSLSSGSNNVFIGNNTGWADTNVSNSIIIGSYMCDASNTTANGPFLAVGVSGGDDIIANNVAVFGSPTVPYSDWYFGEGYSTSTPSDITFQPSVGSGTNIAGSSFYLKGGAGTGNATPGKLYLQYASAGSSGATLQSYTTAVTIDSTATDVTGLLVTDRLKGGTAAPTVSVGAGAGTGATVSVSGTDLAGEITITTGTATPDGGVICTLTFSSAMSSAPFPQLTPADVDAQFTVGNFHVTSTTTTIVINGTGVWPESTELKFNYFNPQ